MLHKSTTTQKITGVISFLIVFFIAFQLALLCSKMYFFANHISSNACIMVLPKLTFVLLCAQLLSPLPWVTICGTHIMASVGDLGKSSTDRGTSYANL